MVLNYTNSIPLHVQLQKVLEDKVMQREYHGKIPSERELMEEYHVSRSTVRQAVSQLVSDGVLEKRPGKGTFVSVRPISDWLGSLSTTSEIIENMNMSSQIKLIKSEIITLNESLQEKVKLKQAYHFVRIRFANNMPIGIERHYYPIDLGTKLSKFNLHQESFYDLLERELNINAIQAEQEIKAGKPSKEDAELLEISDESSVLHTERLITDDNNKFIELEHALYRSDMYSFKIKLSRKSS